MMISCVAGVPHHAHVRLCILIKPMANPVLITQCVIASFTPVVIFVQMPPSSA